MSVVMAAVYVLEDEMVIGGADGYDGLFRVSPKLAGQLDEVVID
jgi:hypothetical protein